MIKILVSDSIAKTGLEILFANARYSLDYRPGLPVADLLKIIPDYDVLLVRSETKVDASVIKAGKQLRLIGRAGAGVDNIDLKTATEQGIIVVNVPGGNTLSAAEHTWALILSLARNLPQAYVSLKQKQWERKKFVGTQLSGKVLGLIGLGRIGKEVATRGLAFGMKVIAYDPYLAPEYAQKLGVELVALDEIYKAADFISLHTSLTDQTRHLINQKAIAKMKTGVRIINCARGAIIDEQALWEGIKSGIVRGAAFDVFDSEPPKNWELLQREEVICTPHLGASTEEAQQIVAQDLATQVDEYFSKGLLRNAVNAPILEPETQQVLSPYLLLAEKMGLLSAQIVEGGISRVSITYSGEIIKYNLSSLTAKFLQGLLTPIIGNEVNFVNANYLASLRGIQIKESRLTQSEDYINAIESDIYVSGEKTTFTGTIFSKNNLRIVRLGEFPVDLVPEGWVLVLRNLDHPGVIGAVGTVLGKNGINIAGMEVGRQAPGKEALTLINVDSDIPKEILSSIEQIKDITNVKLVKL